MNIIILTRDTGEKPSANGICAMNLADAMLKLGHHVKLISYENKTEQSGFAQKTANRFLHLCSSVYGQILPVLDKKICKYYLNEIIHNSSDQVDLIVGAFFPLEVAQVLPQAHKICPKCKTVLFELDSVADGMARPHLRRLYYAAHERWLEKNYQTIDKIVIMRSHEQYWNTRFGKQFGDRLIVSDLPVLCLEHFSPKARKAEKQISFVYSGLLDSRYRSPEKLLSVFSLLAMKVNFTFQFYTKGDCEDKLSSARTTIKGVQQMGYVSPDQLENAVQSSDILVSIGNAWSNSVPSKLITYIGYGKPIIHFCLQENDVCAGYIERYPLGLVIPIWMDEVKAEKQIESFIIATKEYTIEKPVIEKRFMENSPIYSVHKILENVTI